MTSPEAATVVVAPGEAMLVAVGPATHLCPFTEETDTGTVTVMWSTTARLSLELHSLAAYLASFAEVEICHEDLVQRIYDELCETGVDVIAVRWEGETAGLKVAATAGQLSAVFRQSLEPAGA